MSQPSSSKRKKRTMAVDCDVGESSEVGIDQSLALKYIASCFRFAPEELSRCWAVNDHVSESSNGSFALDLCVSGFQSKESGQHVQQMIRQIIQLANNSHLLPRNLALRTRLEEESTVMHVQTTSRQEHRLTGSWSELPGDMLLRIAEDHLFHADDFAIFSSVCHSWHRAAAACNFVKLREKWAHQDQMPWLMLTDGNTHIDDDGYSISDYVLPRVLNDIEDYEFSSETKNTRRVLDLRRNKSYNIDCPEGYGRVCWGSTHGWIVTAGGDGKMFMFNPLTKSRVGLPSFATFKCRWDNEDSIRRNYFVTRAVLLRVGADDDAQTFGDGVENLRVVAFYGDDHVAIVKPGNRRWVEIEGGARSETTLRDVLYDSDMGLVFVDDCGGLLSCNLPEHAEESPVLEWIRPPVPFLVSQNKLVDYVGAYIVKCGDDLLMVERVVCYIGDQEEWDKNRYRDMGYRSDTYYTELFEVYKFNFRKKSWVENYDLKDIALFVGNNASMWVDAPTAGCERSSIYYTDDLRIFYRLGKDKLGGGDSGVRSMIHPFRCQIWARPLAVPEGSNTRSPYSCPLWFRPSVIVPKGLS